MENMRFLFFLLFSFFLFGCSESRQDEVSAWMDKEKGQAVPKIAPLQEPGVFYPVSYERGRFDDPFAFEKLARVFADAKGKSGANLIDRHDRRRREPLEGYPLDAIKMIGFLQKNGKSTAVLSAEDHIYQVIEGNYVGQNFGEVRKITETGLELQEVVQDAAGDWVERLTVLELQE